MIRNVTQLQATAPATAQVSGGAAAQGNSRAQEAG
jgi:hypothetical protein